MIDKLKWIRYEKNPIFEGGGSGKWDRVVEDFVVVKNRNKYYAFYCGGYLYENLNGIGIAISKSPMGPFKRHGRKPIISNDAYKRMGSVMKIGKKWRMYYSEGRGGIFLIESEDLINWEKPIGPLTHYAIQPSCQMFKGKFLLMASDIRRRGILAFFSDDGKKFGSGRRILKMKENTDYAWGLSNPSFIVEGNNVRIFFEGRRREYLRPGVCGWKIFDSVWDGRGKAVINETALIEEDMDPWDGVQQANASVSRFGNRYYIYYSGWGREQVFNTGVMWRDME